MSKPRLRSLVFLLIFGFAVASYLQRQGIGIAAGRMMPELGLTQVQIGAILNAFLIVYAVLGAAGAATAVLIVNRLQRLISRMYLVAD